MDLNRQEVHANMQGGPVPQQVMHGPRPSHGNGTHFQPRMSGAMSGPQFRPQQYVKVNPSYPPGFGMVAPGFVPAVFDYTRSVHGGMNYQESLEITSHTPFIPQRRGDPMSKDRRAHGPTQSFPNNVKGSVPHAEEAPEGSPSELRKKKKRKRSKGSKDAQPAQADTVEAESPIEQVRPTTIQGEPCVPRSGGPAVQRSATHDFDEGAIVCQKLWQDLSSAFKNRERVLREKEQSFTQSTINKDALEKEKIQVAVMQNEILEERRKLQEEVLEERRKLQEEAQRIREANDALESRSTEIALQMVELKQLQKQVGNEKAALLALKAGGNLQEQEGVEVEVEEPEIRESDARQSNTNLKSVKVEPGAPENDAAHRDTSRIDDYPSEDGMDDLPLAQRLKAQRAEKRKEKRRGGPNTMQQEHPYMESGRRKSSMPYDHLKRNKVPIEVALQEDAPGLLEQLEEKGLLRDDITVYQDLGWDDSLANESPGTGFGELEGVIGKLWGNSSGGLAKDLIALKVQANGSGSVPRYCLACLLSLIDQTKSLRKRNWPVNWGWCRRLRAFLFVFEKHNRIVLERPEYGYATYFFELVQRLPVEWQVQRLIVVMSVASTGRAALLGNHQLLVGTHLSDEEAAILEDYGWNRSSGLGLGSLLNFCERVVHDYNKGQDPAELGNDWKQKIGKLLMDGYDQGSILTSSIPRKLEKVLGNTSTTDTTGPCSVKAEPHM